jgi:hypothetical protein
VASVRRASSRAGSTCTAFCASLNAAVRFPCVFQKNLKVGMMVKAGQGRARRGEQRRTGVGDETMIACLPGPDSAASKCTKSRVADRVYGGGREEAI